MKLFKMTVGPLVAALLVLSPLAALANNGRQIGNPANPDAVSWYGGGCDQTANGNGITGCEIAVDWSGDVIPTTNNTQTLGTVGLSFSNAYVNSVTVGAGGVANSGPTNVNGLLVLKQTIVPIGAVQSQIPITTSYEELVPTGNSALTLTATPTIATLGVLSGTVLTLSNISSLIVAIQDNGTLTNSGVRLDSTVLRLNSAKTLTLIFDGGDFFWHMLSYGNN